MKKQTPSTNPGKKSVPSFSAWGILLLILAVIALGNLFLAFHLRQTRVNEKVQTYEEKCDLLHEQIFTEETLRLLGPAPAGEAGHAVFLSLCDAVHQAQVFQGTGPNPEDAWNQAVSAGRDWIREADFELKWLRADVVSTSKTVSDGELSRQMEEVRDNSFRWGLALDPQFTLAFPEARMNAEKLYDYDQHTVSRKQLSQVLEIVPETDTYTLFQTMGWFCDEHNAVLALSSDGQDYGHRPVAHLEKATAEDLIHGASAYLSRQVQDNGRFIYGYFPRLGRELRGYNILRHAGSLWSMICSYRLSPDPQLAVAIEKGVDYLLSQVVESDSRTAYVLEADDSEFKLGGCALALLALTEYSEVFEDDQYLDVCQKLGNGILSFQDPQEGSYIHVLALDFSVKDAHRTVYYDGEATFALCRLYRATGEEKWLAAAEKAADYFVREDYFQYGDHWVNYALNELTDLTDNPDYYTLALKNMTENSKKVFKDTPAPTSLELLGSTWQIYQRMLRRNIAIDDAIGFQPQLLKEATEYRIQRLLDNYWFPELAMYMRRPDLTANAFFVRNEDFRTRIDDVQHSIGGLYLYRQNYDSLYGS